LDHVIFVLPLGDYPDAGVGDDVPRLSLRRFRVQRVEGANGPNVV